MIYQEGSDGRRLALAVRTRMRQIGAQLEKVDQSNREWFDNRLGREFFLIWQFFPSWMRT